jgi:hypothetical protein
MENRSQRRRDERAKSKETDSLEKQKQQEIKLRKVTELISRFNAKLITEYGLMMVAGIDRQTMQGYFFDVGRIALFDAPSQIKEDAKKLLGKDELIYAASFKTTTVPTQGGGLAAGLTGR